MDIPENEIEEFRRLHRKHFGEEISREEAYRLGRNFLELIDAVIRPEERWTGEERLRRTPPPPAGHGRQGE